MTTVLIILIGLVVLILSGLPVAFCLSFVSVIYLLLNGIPLGVAVQRMTTGVESYIMLAIPFFIFAGELMNHTGVTDRIFKFANTLVGHITGGLAHVNIVASILFAGMSGSIAADVGGLGTIEIKAMKDRGFPSDFSAAVTASSALIGPIIPPSIHFIIFGGLTGVSVARLFIAGAIPGLVMGVSLMVLSFIIAKTRNYPIEPKATFSEFLYYTKEAFLSLLTPIIIIGGILGGIFTPTEASSIAVLYALILGIVYHEIQFKDLSRVFNAAIKTTCKIMFLLASANLFSWVLIRERVGPFLVENLSLISENNTIILLIICFIAIIMGLFMDASTNLVVLIPILLPAIRAMGFDLVHFGVVVVIAFVFGSITPPVGIAMYIACEIANISVYEFFKATLPFFIILIIALLTIIFFPSLATWLPSLL